MTPITLALMILSTADGLVSSEFVFEQAPFPSCHASTIAETDSGLVAAWFGGQHEKAPDVGIWLSRREAGKWTAPVEVADGEQTGGKRLPCWNPVLFQVQGGPLILFYKVGPDPEKWWGMKKTSADAGKTWTAAERLPDGILGPIKNKPVALKDGAVLASSSTEDDRDRWRIHFERSADGGKTWARTPDIAADPPINAIQPSVLVHADNRLQAIGRTRSGHVFEVWSDDLGKTWGKMTLTALPNPNAGTDAVTLADGRHLLVYNHSGKARSPLNVAVSADGKTWKAALVLEQDPGEYSYPAVIQTRDGLVHITYTWKRKRIKHVTIDPKGLSLREMPQRPNMVADKMSQTVEALTQAKTPGELGKIYHSLVGEASTETLRLLKVNKHDGIALKAGWQELCATVPAERLNRDVPIDPLLLSRFAGFVEGRLKVLIPSWWLGALRSAYFDRQADVRFTGGREPVGYESVGCGLRGFPNITLKEDPAGLVVKVDDRSVMIPSATAKKYVFDERVMGKSCVAAFMDNESCYLAVHESCTSHYSMHSFDVKTGQHRWSTEIWADGDVVIHSGRSTHMVAINTSENRVFVFGASGFAVYVEAFQCDTGKNVFRFSSSY